MRVLCECPNESGLPVVASRKQHAWSSLRFRSRLGSPYDQLNVVPVMGVVDENEGGITCEPPEVLQIDGGALVYE